MRCERNEKMHLKIHSTVTLIICSCGFDLIGIMMVVMVIVEDAMMRKANRLGKQKTKQKNDPQFIRTYIVTNVHKTQWHDGMMEILVIITPLTTSEG